MHQNTNATSLYVKTYLPINLILIRSTANASLLDVVHVHHLIDRLNDASETGHYITQEQNVNRLDGNIKTGKQATKQTVKTTTWCNIH